MRVGDATYSEIQLTMEERGRGVLQRAEPSKIEHQNGLESGINVEARFNGTCTPKGSLISGAAGRLSLQLPVAGIVYDRLI